jgi:SAM-dependent methyltransferase
MGVPRLSVLEALSRSARDVVIAAPDRQAVETLNVEVARRNLRNVTAVRVGRRDALPFPEESFDLVVFARSTAEPKRSPRLVAELQRVVRPDGTVYLEGTSRGVRSFLRRWNRDPRSAESWTAQQFWMIRRGVLAAIPLGDVSKLAGFFFRDVLYGRSGMGRLLSPIARGLAERNLLHHLLPGRALVLRRRPMQPPEKPFDYLVRVAERNGLDLSAHRSALLARGAYDSNKVAVYFLDRLRNVPEVIVKMTRTPEFNHRLETEYRSLRALGELGIVESGTYPEALFLDEHRGLAVVAQKVVTGSPFRARTTGRPDCPFGRDAIAWITRLGAATADADGASVELFDRLSRLVSRFATVYALTAAERQFLEERITSIGRSSSPVPLVFRHGDAGTWNILVTDAGRSAFLDWEVSELQGPPLWDLFDFIRSFGTWIGRTQGQRDTTAIYESAFLARGPLADLQRTAVREYCDRVGVAPQHVEALFYTCWIQRALREAAWTSQPLSNGTYMNLLRLCIHGRRSPGLSWLLD